MKRAVLVAFLGAGAFMGALDAAPPDAAADHGREVYAAQKCALCHSISGIGGKKSALDGVGTKMTADSMRKWIRTPKAMKPDTTMKAYPNLPEKDLSDLTAFLLTLK